MLSLDGERRSQPLIATPFGEFNGEISPDGAWLAYQSRESSGPSEIYVRPFPDVERGRQQISTSGGTRPMWARSGRELFYLATDGRLMAVAIQADSTSAFSHGNPRVVADTPTWAPLPGRSYDVSPDGQRFLMLKERERRKADETPSQLIVVLNWLEELKRLAPAN